MNCSYCGTEIPYDERFCRNCGRAAEPPAPTVYSGSGTPDPRRTESFGNEQYNVAPPTQRYNAPAQTGRDWPVQQVNVPPAAPAGKERSSWHLPLTVASIMIALASLGVLAYFVFFKTNVDNSASTSSEKPTPAASPIASNSSPTPTPTVESPAAATATVTPTPVPSPSPTPTPNNVPPPGARLGYCNDANVFVRSAPNLTASPVSKLARGQNIWVLSTSTNYSTWNGITSNWTLVQLYNSSVRGWVFSPFVSFQADQ